MRGASAAHSLPVPAEGLPGLADPRRPVQNCAQSMQLGEDRLSRHHRGTKRQRICAPLLSGKITVCQLISLGSPWTKAVWSSRAAYYSCRSSRSLPSAGCENLHPPTGKGKWQHICRDLAVGGTEARLHTRSGGSFELGLMEMMHKNFSDKEKTSKGTRLKCTRSILELKTTAL